jgi:hypothetical protein
MAKKDSVNNNEGVTIDLGDRVEDRVTGIKGIVVAVTFWLNGCQRLVIQPPADKDNKLVDAITVDVEQVALVKKHVIEVAEKVPTGGPMSRKLESAATRR